MPGRVRGGIEAAGCTVVAGEDRELQRRDLSVTANGAVRETTRTLVPDLPVPYVL